MRVLSDDQVERFAPLRALYAKYQRAIGNRPCADLPTRWEISPADFEALFRKSGKPSDWHHGEQFGGISVVPSAAVADGSVRVIINDTIPFGGNGKGAPSC